MTLRPDATGVSDTCMSGLSAGAGRGAPRRAPADGIHKRTAVDVKPIERRFTQPAARSSARAAAPTVSGTDFVALKNAKKKRVTDALIAKMRLLIDASAEDDPQKPDFFFRAGELYARSSATTSTRRARWTRRSSRCRRRAAGLRVDSSGSSRRSRAWLLEAVKAYIAATRYPKYERMDEVLFRLAALLTSVKKDDQAREFFHRLIKDYPTSKYIPDAYLAFAEHAFETGEMEAALKFYEKVEQFPKSKRLSVRRLQEGLVPREPGRLPDRAGDVRRRRAADAVREAVAVDRRQLEMLAKEAKKDVVKAYAHVGGAGQGAAVLREGRRRLRAQDDGAARGAVLGGGQGAGIDARLQADHRRQHGEPARLRVAEQGAAQHAVAAELRQGAGGAGAGAAGRRVRGAAGAAEESRRRSAASRSTTPRASWR